MSAELKSHPVPPIKYGNKKVRPPKGRQLGDLEALAWNLWKAGIILEDMIGHGRMYKINRPLFRIQELFIEQYG